MSYLYSGSAIIPAGTTSIDLPLASSGGPISYLSSLLIGLDPGAGTNFDLNAVGVQTVPEPGSMAALGFGVAAVWRRRKRV